MADALGMQRGVADRERAAVGHPEQRDPLEPGGVDDRGEIRHPRVQREVADLPVREAAAAFVVADDRVPFASPSSQCRQTGLPQSSSRWVSQVAVRTSGGPLPWLAYAMRVPSADVQNRTVCLTGHSKADRTSRPEYPSHSRAGSCTVTQSPPASRAGA